MADKNKEKRLLEEIHKCRECIDKTRKYIEHHRTTLKNQEKRLDELTSKLDKEKMNSLMNLIHQGGYDIDKVREAVSSGQLQEISADTTEKIEIKPKSQDISAKMAEENAITERKDKK